MMSRSLEVYRWKPIGRNLPLLISSRRYRLNIKVVPMMAISVPVGF